MFTLQSKIDFSFLGAILPVMLLVLIIWGFFACFAFDSFAFRQVYALGGTVIFSLCATPRCDPTTPWVTPRRHPTLTLPPHRGRTLPGTCSTTRMRSRPT